MRLRAARPLEEIEITPKNSGTNVWMCIPDLSDVAHYPYRVTRQMLEEAMDELKERVVKITS